MNDDIIEGDSKHLLQAVDAGESTPATSLRGRLSIADEQLRAATRVIESELGKAYARARALNVDNPDADG